MGVVWNSISINWFKMLLRGEIKTSLNEIIFMNLEA